MSTSSRNAMSPNDEGANDSPRKMKSNEVGESSNAAVSQPPTLNLIDSVGLGAPHVPLLGSSETFQMRHTAPQARPFSYQYLLMDAPDPEGYLFSFDHPSNGSTSQPTTELTLAQHGENLTNQLTSVVANIAEKAQNKLNELELESRNIASQRLYLEDKTRFYREQAEEAENKLKSLKQTASSLRKTLTDVNKKCMEAEAAPPENEESHYVELVTVPHVRLDCLVCRRQVATMIMMNCQHLCVCKQCEPSTRNCPVCQQPKGKGFEVFFPYEEWKSSS